MYIEGSNVYSQRLISVVVLGLVVSLGVVSGISVMEAEKPILHREPFTPSDSLDLNFSTYIGGSDYDSIGDIILDSNGDIYIAGFTESVNLPTTENAYAKSHSGGNYWEFWDVFFMKLSGDGQEILYCSYLGGSHDDDPSGIAIDKQGCVYIVGRTRSADFPTVNAYDSSYNGGSDCFVTKFSTNGREILFSTYIGGSGEEGPIDFELDDEGNCIIVGHTDSPDFPVITTNQQPACHSQAGPSDGFVFKLASDGSELEYSMYLGGSGYDRCADVTLSNSGDVFIGSSTGSTDFPVKRALDDSLNGIGDCALTKLNASGHILSSTYFGGNDTDHPRHIGLDDTGLVYVAGVTYGGPFPSIGVTNPLFNGTKGIFLSIIDLEGKEVVFSGVMKNTRTVDYRSGVSTIIVVSEHEVWISGFTEYFHFPITDNAFDKTFAKEEGFIAMVDPTSCSLNYSTLFGGSEYDTITELKVSEEGDVMGVGHTDSPDIPIKNALYPDKLGSEHDTDGFVFRFRMETTLTFTTTTPIETPSDLVFVITAGVSIGVALVVVSVIIMRRK